MIELPLEPRTCEYCGGNDLEPVWANQSVVRKSLGTYLFRVHLVVCRICGFCFASPGPSRDLRAAISTRDRRVGDAAIGTTLQRFRGGSPGRWRDGGVAPVTRDNASVVFIGTSVSIGDARVERFRAAGSRLVVTYCWNNRFHGREDVRALQLDLASEISIEWFITDLPGAVEHVDTVLFLSGVGTGS
jgi:hypothetical protein